MNTIEIIETLRNFNEWRRYDGPIGEAPEQLSPKKIGEAIDGAVELLSKTIRAEVERLKEEHKEPTFRGDEYEEGGLNGYQLALDKVLAKLDTLQEQPVCEGLEMAVNSYLHHYEYPREEIDFYAFARHFYELGQQSKEIVSDDLKDVAKKHRSTANYHGDINLAIEDSFVKGYLYCKEQSKQEVSEDELYKEIERWINSPEEWDNNIQDIEATARHFAKWGAEHLDK